MDRLKLLPIFLLIGSLLVLLGLFLSKAVSTRRQAMAISLTQTAIIEQATATPASTSTPEPTATPSPSLTPNLPSPTVTEFPTYTPRPGEIVEEGCLEAILAADVTIPDGTLIDADHKFIKTWRLYNSGTCTWTTGFDLIFVSGDKMAGPDKQRVFPVDVPPGLNIDISVTLRAPQKAGTYRGYWGLEDEYGNVFGLGPAGKPFYVEIEVIE